MHPTTMFRNAFLLLALATSPAVLGEFVETLTDSSLPTVVADNQFVLVEFYAPWYVLSSFKAATAPYPPTSTLQRDDVNAFARILDGLRQEKRSPKAESHRSG